MVMTFEGWYKIVLAGQNDDLTARGMMGRAEHTYLFYDPEYSRLPPVCKYFVQTYPKEYHATEVDYHNRKEIEKEIINTCKPAKKVNINIACEDRLGMAYAIPIFAAMNSARVLSFMKDVEIAMRSKGEEKTLKSPKPFNPLSSISLEDLKVLTTIEDGQEFPRKLKIPSQNILVRNDLISVEYIGLGIKEVSFSETGLLFKELLS